MLDEFTRIARFFKPLASGYGGALGLGDDAALVSVPEGHELVVTADAMVEGVHFLMNQSPESIARRLLRSNLSDLAAMGAVPHAYMLVTSLPQHVAGVWLEAFTRALHEDQHLFSCHLIGGDSVSTKGPITLSITALGLVPVGAALRRTIKKPLAHAASFDLYVTGTIGDSALGLQLVLDKKVGGLDSADEEYLKQRHLAPTPRLKEGIFLREHALAAIDISDGLVADCEHIAEQSGLEIIINAADIPLSPAAQKALAADPALLETVLTGGEDYELAFVAEPGDAAMLKQNGFTKIGRVQHGVAGACTVLDKKNQPVRFTRKGWQHF